MFVDWAMLEFIANPKLTNLLLLGILVVLCFIFNELENAVARRFPRIEE
jgi:hypothetical protein